MIVFNYFAVPREIFNQLAAAEDRYEAATDLLLESEEFPTTDIDKFWVPLGQYLDKSPALAAVYGTEEWDSELRVSAPEQVVKLAQALADIDLANLQQCAAELNATYLKVESDSGLVESVEELLSFYSEAAERGDAIVVIDQ